MQVQRPAFRLSALSLALGLFATSPVLAETDNGNEEDEGYHAVIAEMEATEGLLNLYRDPQSGEMLFSIHAEQLDNPIIYHAQTLDGVVEIGHFRGNYRETKLLEFRRYYDRIDVVAINPRFQFDEDNALSRASDANISEALLASLPIKEEEEGRLLLSADDLFLTEALHKVAPWGQPNGRGRQGFSLGGLSSDHSRIMDQRAYSNNTDVVVDYVFLNPEPTSRGSNAITDPRSVTVKLQHSFIELPDNDYQPRRDDARVGYFTQQFDDMTSAEWAPYNDVINRWNLEKQDPDAELSEPVEPIVWWIENTTPEEWRDVIAEGVLAWNEAFAAAGFKNALEVRVQPDDADWDAGDVNYNVIRWTSSPRPPFGGYGPSLANPLTGELIGADIMMEFGFMSSRWLEDEVYEGGESHGLYCSLGHEIQADRIAGQAMAGLAGSAIEDNEILRQGMIHVILHEVGHTLGLNHNMKASIMWDEEEVHDAELTQGVLTGSVMDYAPVNVAPPGVEQGDYYQFRVGPYDSWAIEYGYSPAAEDPATEEERLESILSRSHEQELAFGNDADDMRAPGRHIDPRIMTGDMSSDPVAYARGRFERVTQTFDDLLDNARSEGESHQSVATSANLLFNHYRGQANVVTRQIGGVHIERAVVGQADDIKPFEPVPREQQVAAMQTLAEYVFAPDVLTEMFPTLNYLQQQRRGFSHMGSNEDPQVHTMILGMQRGALDHLLHENVLQRISDTTLYGNEYPLNEFMGDLTRSIFPDQRTLTTVSQNLQVEYVERLIRIAGLDDSGSMYDNLSRAAALGQLNNIKSMRAPRGSALDLVNHYEYLQLLIHQAQNA